MGGYFFISTMVYNTMIRIKAMYSIVSTPSKMRRQGFVDGIACAAAFFHRGLCPLCGGGFRRCRSESLLFTPAEEGGRCPPACRLRHGLGKSYRKAFTESHISTQKSGGIKPPLFAFYQNHSAGTNPGHHFPLCARTASRLSLVRNLPNNSELPW